MNFNQIFSILFLFSFSSQHVEWQARLAPLMELSSFYMKSKGNQAFQLILFLYLKSKRFSQRGIYYESDANTFSSSFKHLIQSLTLKLQTLKQYSKNACVFKDFQHLYISNCLDSTMQKLLFDKKKKPN